MLFGISVIHKLSKSVLFLSKSVDQMRQDKDALQTRLDNVIKNGEAYRRQIKEYEKDLVTVCDTRDKLKGENESVYKRLQEKVKQISELKLENKTLLETLATQRDTIDTLESKIERIQDINLQLRNSNDDLRKRVNEFESGDDIDTINGTIRIPDKFNLVPHMGYFIRELSNGVIEVCQRNSSIGFVTIDKGFASLIDARAYIKKLKKSHSDPAGEKGKHPGSYEFDGVVPIGEYVIRKRVEPITQCPVFQVQKKINTGHYQDIAGELETIEKAQDRVDILRYEKGKPGRLYIDSFREKSTFVVVRLGESELENKIQHTFKKWESANLFIYQNQEPLPRPGEEIWTKEELEAK